MLDNLRAVHAIVGDFGRSGLVSRGRISTPAGRSRGETPAESRNRVEVVRSLSMHAHSVRIKYFVASVTAVSDDKGGHFDRAPI